MKVICNCAGQDPECKNCGASKPHDNDSCEPCPIIKEARCVPCGQPPIESYFERKVRMFLYRLQFHELHIVNTISEKNESAK